MNNQRRRKSIESLNLSSILPNNLIVQILLRLPVRSLLRFKSVCKSWLSLISDPQFGKSHLDLAAAPTNRCIVKINDFKFESLDVDASLHDYSSKVNLKFPLIPSPRRYNGYFGVNHIEILGSCRGFMALLYPGGGVIVWNPSTCVQREIADHIEHKIYQNLYGFGYDKSTDDYLLVLIDLIPLEDLEDLITAADYHSSIELFPLKSHSLFYLELIPYAKMDSCNNNSLGSFLNEALHWLVINADTNLHAIIAYDLVERCLSEITMSPILAEKLKLKQLGDYDLQVMGECLSLCYSGGATSMGEIWMMKEYKVQSSWTKLFVFSTSNIPQNVFFPFCFTKHGRIFGTNGFDRFMILNDKGWLLDQCKTGPLNLNSLFWLSDCSMYRESLLSLPNDFEEESGDFEEASEDDDFEEESGDLEEASDGFEE